MASLSVIVPDKWKEGASNVTEGGGRKVNENKLLSKKQRPIASPDTHSILPEALTGHMPMLKATAVAPDKQLQHTLQSATAPAFGIVPYPPFEAL
ncbi:MAG: postsynaptic CRIPT [Trebouxia sp. A1-2]|nr:MAG: postsynaptic CRIPT [Trebouxia sp. A1-2]